MTKIPASVWSGSFRIFGVDVRCHVLDDGQRVIEEGSMVALLEAMGDPGNKTLDDKAMMDFARWQKGL